jgi:hypothetical protein
MTFMDPWLPDDDSYEMCGPYRSRFRAVNLSASGSQLFVIGAHGDLFTRLYDFDLAGHDEVFMRYAYTKSPPAIQLPAPAWVRQPKVPGAITSAISIEKTGVGARDAILRVEGRRGGRSGYWEKRLLARSPRAWRFHRDDRRLRGTLLDNPQRDSSRVGLAAHAEDLRFSGDAGALRVAVEDFNVSCTPATLTVAAGRRAVTLRLHSVDALRQVPRARGLDANPRALYATIEVPPAVRARAAALPPALRALLRGPLGARFTKVEATATTRTLTLARGELDWELTR